MTVRIDLALLKEGKGGRFGKHQSNMWYVQSKGISATLELVVFMPFAFQLLLYQIPRPLF